MFQVTVGLDPVSVDFDRQRPLSGVAAKLERRANWRAPTEVEAGSHQPVGFPPFWVLGMRWLSPPNSK
ncbi:MAG: hypothetical protein WA376_10210, partial [Terrimicrobiaceae bacterium]